MSTGFVQTGKTQTIATVDTSTWKADPLVFNQSVGAIRVVNIGTNVAQIILSDSYAEALSASNPAAGTPTKAITMLPNSEEVFGPFSGPVYVNASGASGNTIEFTPGSGGL